MLETSIYATCPFWYKDKQKHIQCETLLDMKLNETRTVLFFKEPTRCDEFKRTHCYHMTGYKTCPLYKILWNKYEELENEEYTRN